MNKLIFKAPINSLSFGNVSFNLLKEMFKKSMEVAIFPIGKVELSSFSGIDESFKSWLEDGINNRYSKIDKDDTTLHMWHLNGAEERISKNKILYSFYELDEPTEEELKISEFQDKIVFSSSYAQSKFPNSGFAPLGFDDDFHKIDKEYMPGKTHFGIMGKYEKRKHTKKIIQAWIKKYGNNYKYQLSCCITNPFFKKQDMEGLINDILGGKRCGNVNFLPYLPKNSQVNDYLNSIDIDIGGMSGAEGWNLPSFNSTCLGKWSVVLNATSHKDWANKDNCVLVEPDGKEPVYDQAFFTKGSQFNQGSIYTFDEDEFVSAMEKAELLCKNSNTEGEKLKEKFTYSKTLENILS
jgi:hypothetical protein